MTDIQVHRRSSLPTLKTPGLRLGLVAVIAAIAVLAVIGVPVTMSDPATAVYGAPWRLGLKFWVEVVVGLGAFLIAGWVWALKPGNLATRLFLASGAATLAFTFAAAAYNTPGVSLGPQLSYAFAITNAGGASAFGMAMVALFCIYPVRLPGWRLLLAVNALVFGGWTLAALRGLLPMPWASVHLVTLVEMIGILIAAGAQYWATRRDATARAVAIWFGLSVMLGAGAFITLVALPNVIGVPARMEAGYAFAFFLIIYVGVAAGLRRYRLFELGEWAFRILFYLAGGLLLLAIDAALITVIALDPAAALSLALLAVAFIYMPLRDLIARKVLLRSRLSEDELFRAVMSVALEPSPAAKPQRWHDLLQRMFDPLEMRTSSRTVSSPEVRADGAELVMPPIAGAEALVLSFPWAGRGLFAPRHVRTCDQLIALVRQAEASRQSYDRGVAEERGRIARDMHDNIGAQLLGALHSQGGERKDALIRETLGDLRDIINNASGPGLPVVDALADLRAETAERAAGAGLDLDWVAEVDEDTVLSPARLHGLRSVVREAVSNVIKHAGAKSLDIRLAINGPTMRLAIRDDGTGFDTGGTGAGHGLANMQTRLGGLGGRVEIESGGDGTRLTAEFPLHARETR